MAILIIGSGTILAILVENHLGNTCVSLIETGPLGVGGIVDDDPCSKKKLSDHISCSGKLTKQDTVLSQNNSFEIN